MLELNHVKSVCGLGSGDKTCSFLMMGTGWECAKGSRLESAIRKRREANTMNAMGDNCSGPPEFLIRREPEDNDAEG